MPAANKEAQEKWFNLYRQGLDDYQIGAILNVNPKTIGRYRKIAGVPSLNYKRPRRKHREEGIPQKPVRKTLSKEEWELEKARMWELTGGYGL